MKKPSLLIIIILFSLLSCSTNDYIWTSTNEIQANQKGEIVITGTASGVSKNKYIKSPYILRIDSNLNLIDRHSFPTLATALNPKIHLQGQNNLLYFYGADSSTGSIERSRIVFLDEEYEQTSYYQYGDKTRLECLISIDSNRIITCNYDRRERSIKVICFQDEQRLGQATFSASNETTIPTDMILTGNNNILISSIANGFHYQDGHDYINEKAFGYLLKTNLTGDKILEKTIEGKQHLFINDIMQTPDGKVFITGTEQQDETGMDLLLVELDSSLSIKKKIVDNKKRIQKGIKSVWHNDHIYVLAKSENMEDHNMKISIHLYDIEGKLKWNKTIDQDSSYDPKEFIIHNEKLYIIADKKATRTSTQYSVLAVVSLDGELLQELEITSLG